MQRNDTNEKKEWMQRCLDEIFDAGGWYRDFEMERLLQVCSRMKYEERGETDVYV